MNVAFLNENTLGHTSYLPRFAEALRTRPESGITPHVLDVLPLPAHLRRLGDTSIRGLRKFGLDFHGTRWRVAISRHAREQLEALQRHTPLDALLVNTQSAGLELDGLPEELPVLVSLDATFQQLADSPWFAPNRPSRWFQWLTLGGLRRRERRLFARTTRFLPWSEIAAGSLRGDYGISADRISVLPPSLAIPPVRRQHRSTGLPQILFLGGDFARKGGPLLLEVFRRHFAGRAELHVVTHSPVSPEPGVFVHHDVKAGSQEWLQRWQDADLFVFPSRLETFGIVLLEALAFEVPIIASTTGAARDILGHGSFGTLLENLTPAALHTAIQTALAQPETARETARAGRRSFLERFELDTNTRKLAEILHGVHARARK